MIDQGSIDKIYDSAEIVDVVQDFVTLRKRGVNYLGLCPFHNEKTPSFTVSPTKGIYKCFGCGKGGNSVNFVMEHENMSYVEALRFLAKKYHIEFEEKELTPEELELRNAHESLRIVSAYAQEYFSGILVNHADGKAVGLSYLKERGFREDIIEKFQLGFCLDKKREFTDHCVNKGYKLEYLVQSGLTIQKEDWIVDRFSARVMFPIHDLAGRVIAFGGRTLVNDKKVAKYLNSPESEIYHKSKVLYGIYQAKRTIVQNDRCYLVEGYTDVVSFHQAGIENVVASSGTSLTSDQIRLIKRFTPNITILYDGDDAGIKASLRGIDLILEEGMNVKVVLFPAGEDPDSYSRSRSSSELLGFLEKNEQDFISFKTGLLKQESANDPVKKANMISDIVGSIASIPDRIKRSVFIRECSSNLGVSEEILYGEIGKILRRKNDQINKRPYGESEVAAPRARHKSQINIGADEDGQFEEEIIRLLVKYGNIKFYDLKDKKGNPIIINVAQVLIKEMNSEKDLLQFRKPDMKEIYEIVEKQVNSSGTVNTQMLVNHPDQSISTYIAGLLSKEYNLSQYWKKKDNYIETEEQKLEELVPETIFALKHYRIKTLLKQSEEKLKEKLTEDELMKTLGIIRNLQKINQSLSKKLGDRTIV
jgi:DNA primase